MLGEQHPEHPFPSTYSRGKKCLDYILLSSSIAPSVLCSLFYSDHRPCYIDIDTKLLFQEDSHALHPRGLQLMDPQIIIKYNNNLHDQLSYHHIVEKYRNLIDLAYSDLWAPEWEDEYKKID